MNSQYDRPISDAAEAVKTLAEHALAMLKDAQAGWLWKLLVQKPQPKE